MAVLDVLRSKRLFRYYGPGDATSQVEALEDAVAKKFEVVYVLAVSSGSMALASALVALGVGTGGEVIVPAYTRITERTKIPLTVHMRGGASNIAGLEALAQRHGVRILEVLPKRAAQATVGVALGPEAEAVHVNERGCCARRCC